uniref:Uncharacterized protein n=1 Tax=Lepeophtheirus salmonis TaxID=72036 RepID=A0A0K2UT44_LEPSM
MPTNRFAAQLLRNVLRINGSRTCCSTCSPFSTTVTKLKVPVSSSLAITRFYSDDSSNDVHLSKEASPSPEVPEPLVKIEKDTQYHIMSIGINRPNKRNCVNYETSEALLQAFLDFEADNEMNVAILYGEGGNFCAGYDLEELSDLDEGNFADKIAHIAMGKGPMGSGNPFFFSNIYTDFRKCNINIFVR